ncbi:ABC transporter substrate-binding protein [Pontixanthobacter sp.]|uniref:ABC transporter substrate-binding protein n=1 Tax=Pontixanthobacter sp. TaxID=2792078 RepID=UPI003C7B16F3
MTSFFRTCTIIAATAMAAACNNAADDDVTRIAFIGSPDDLTKTGVRLSPAGQHIRAAKAEGIVRLNETGEVVPAIAERWIVTEDGLSYIFRLRNSDWSDGRALTANTVRASLQRNIRNLRGTSLGLDLAIIDDIRAMTGRVIEIRLNKPMPQFLQLLAQPELGLLRDGAGTGPMMSEQTGTGVRLSVLPPENSGMPPVEGWQEAQRAIFVTSQSAEAATQAFEDGETDAVFNGTLSNLPLADIGPLSAGTVRLDAVFGLYGIAVRSRNGFLADAENREALALAIDRETILQPFNIGGWIATTRIIPPNLPDANVAQGERWADLSLETRQERARARVTAWKNANAGTVPRLSLALPDGPGSDIMMRELSADYAVVGIELVRAEDGQRSELVLVDQLARYGDVRWFLNQLNCAVARGICSSEADRLVAQALREDDPATRLALLTDAERVLLSENGYIPIGAPIRWSLIRGGVEGFEENRWGLHPLFPMALRPI